MDLNKTVELMNSSDYRERFQAEYLQTKERYERLKRFNNTIETAELIGNEVKHDCPLSLLRRQQSVMGEYLHILELRAELENVELEGLYEH
jgi:hypothetical protein